MAPLLIPSAILLTIAVLLRFGFHMGERSCN